MLGCTQVLKIDVVCAVEYSLKYAGLYTGVEDRCGMCCEVFTEICWAVHRC